MTRIHIIAGPGSGKTTLARTLAAHLNISFHELDTVGWEGGFGAARPLEARLNDIHLIAIQPDWISEGSFLGWTEELLQTADQIVWLDLPWRIACWRILTRHIKASLAGTNRHPGLLKLYRFLGDSRKYYTNTHSSATYTRLSTRKALAPYMRKVVHCQRPADVKAFLRTYDPPATRTDATPS